MAKLAEEILLLARKLLKHVDGVIVSRDDLIASSPTLKDKITRSYREIIEVIVTEYARDVLPHILAMEGASTPKPTPAPVPPSAATTHPASKPEGRSKKKRRPPRPPSELPMEKLIEVSVPTDQERQLVEGLLARHQGESMAQVYSALFGTGKEKSRQVAHVTVVHFIRRLRYLGARQGVLDALPEEIRKWYKRLPTLDPDTLNHMLRDGPQLPKGASGLPVAKVPAPATGPADGVAESERPVPRTPWWPRMTKIQADVYLAAFGQKRITLNLRDISMRLGNHPLDSIRQHLDGGAHAALALLVNSHDDSALNGDENRFAREMRQRYGPEPYKGLFWALSKYNQTPGCFDFLRNVLRIAEHPRSPFPNRVYKSVVRAMEEQRDSHRRPQETTPSRGRGTHRVR